MGALLFVGLLVSFGYIVFHGIFQALEFIFEGTIGEDAVIGISLVVAGFSGLGFADLLRQAQENQERKERQKHAERFKQQ